MEEINYLINLCDLEKYEIFFIGNIQHFLEIYVMPNLTIFVNNKNASSGKPIFTNLLNYYCQFLKQYSSLFLSLHVYLFVCVSVSQFVHVHNLKTMFIYQIFAKFSHKVESTHGLVLLKDDHYLCKNFKWNYFRD